MNKELIEKLKRNEKPFGLLSKEEKECIRKAGMENVQYYNGDNWINKPCAYPDLFTHSTYRIKPDYQPEPEYEDVEIVMHGKCLGGNENLRLGIWNANSPRFWIPLYEIPAMPNFVDFHHLEKLDITDIATDINRGLKVYARFRRS